VRGEGVSNFVRELGHGFIAGLRGLGRPRGIGRDSACVLDDPFVEDDDLEAPLRKVDDGEAVAFGGGATRPRPP
jgi:hypothetical protein